MRICLDARTVGPHMHGIARYARNLVHALRNVDSPHSFHVIGQDPTHFRFLGEAERRVSFLRVRIPPYSLREQVVLPWVVAQMNPDIYHCLTYACPVMVPSPLFVTVHDLLPLARPGEFSWRVRGYYRTFVRIGLARAARIVVDSRYTAFQCSHLLGIPHERIRVVSLGGDHLRHISVSRSAENSFKLLHLDDAPYFLCVGNPRPHKRVLYIAKVFLSDNSLRSLNAHLVLAGELDPRVRAWISKNDRNSRVHCTGYVSDELLFLLYRNAVALVCPSVGEGFGLPVLEAMRMGIPVLASQDGAQSELVTAAGILLPPDEEESWKRAMSDILLNPGKRNGCRVLAAQKSLNYSWHITATRTVAAYEEFLLGSGA